MTIITLGSRDLNARSKPYIIAEIGVNHEGSLDQAKLLIELAKQGGADAAKFQSYKAKTLTSKNSPSYWDINKESTRNQYDLFKKYDAFNAEDYVELAEHCNKVGIDFLSTPFDDYAIDFLDPLMPFFKIASADLTNIPFLRKIGAKKKPVVLSTGASTLSEVDGAMDALRKAGCCEIVLLHCILNYPTSNENASLAMIKGLQRAYPENLIGYSDHTLPDDLMLTLLSAHLSGAVVLEKHFTYDKTLPGNDHYHSMDVYDLKRFVEIVDRAHTLLGSTDHKAPLDTEALARINARRSIVLAKDVDAGEKLTENHLTYKRPGFGVSPQYWDDVIGRVAVRRLQEDQLLRWNDLVEKAE